MKAIVAAGLVFCFALFVVIDVADGAVRETAQTFFVTRVGLSSLMPRTGLIASLSRIGRKVADKAREEKSASPSRTSRQAVQPPRGWRPPPCCRRSASPSRSKLSAWERRKKPPRQV